SAPSSIDGMVWPGYDAFLEHIGQHHPGVRVAVDLCYVGCVGSGAYRVAITAPCIDTIFFSLSKVFGVYYHRIGGVLSVDPLPGLHGNVWFKNLLSIRFGTELMAAYGPTELPQKYRPVQELLVEELRSAIEPTIEPCDVLLLARAPGRVEGDRFSRSPEGRRYCLTPALDERLAKRR
ncbi:MAG: hypothetical protein AAF721_27245, partial [Myxococcota bacterium]